MARRRTTLRTGWLLIAGLWIGAAPSARAQAHGADRNPMPRSLREGAPARRFTANPRARTVTPPQARPTPAPSIVIDPHELAARPSAERRSAALLKREIALLERLARNYGNRSERHADALLRLAYALQELMFQQKQRIHQLQEAAHGTDCRCSAPPDASANPTALACAR